MGRDFSNDYVYNEEEYEEFNLKYLNLINVPTMFDIGCQQADPLSNSLVLNMIDYQTHKILRKNFLNQDKDRKVDSIEARRKEIQAMTSNMNISSIDILFDEIN